MENLIFSLNATLPIFLLMVAGMIFRKIGWLDDALTKGMNEFVFKACLPLMLFTDLAKQDFAAAWDGRFVLFCIAATIISILLVTILSRFVCRDRGARGEFIQASYRSSAAILGVAFIQNIYGSGDSGMAPLMILGSVPIYNAVAVIVLMLTAETEDGSTPKIDGALVKKTLIGIAKNPIILGIVIGLVWSLLGIPLPNIAASTLSKIGSMASPLGLIAMGASFRLQAAKDQLFPSIAAAFNKLLLLPGIFLPLAVWFGFTGQQLVALIVMLGSATTVASYVMVRNMGHKGTLTATTVMITTLGTSFTLTLWLWVAKSLGLV